MTLPEDDFSLTENELRGELAWLRRDVPDLEALRKALADYDAYPTLMTVCAHLLDVDDDDTPREVLG